VNGCFLPAWHAVAVIFFRIPAQLHHLGVLGLLVLSDGRKVAPRPVDAATAPGRGNGRQPKYSNTMFLANISPNPSMTPLTNGKSKLIAKDDSNAVTRVRVERERSNIARVADSRGADGGGCGEGVLVRSGKDMDGNEEVSGSDTSSHF